jgi:hydrogenase maturation factor HypF (carbamoyltransferase family)
MAGKIVAVRGLGGYQLLVDATNQNAVVRLRERKARRAKPLAVMVESLKAARRLAHLNQDEVAAFNDPSAPIVLARANANNGLGAGDPSASGYHWPDAPNYPPSCHHCARNRATFGVYQWESRR